MSGAQWFGHWTTFTRKEARVVKKRFERDYPNNRFRIKRIGIDWVIQIKTDASRR